MPYDGGNTTGFPSPATIYLEAVIDLAAILDLRKPSRYPVRVVGGALPARGIAEKDILVVDCALDRARSSPVRKPRKRNPGLHELPYRDGN
jgi:hypothetical protein